MTAKHRNTTNHHGTHTWLGTGAITLGIGAAALVCGAGVAQAKVGNPHAPAGPTHAAAADKPSSTAPKKAHGPKPSAAAQAPAATSITSTAAATPTPKIEQHSVAAAFGATPVTATASVETPTAASAIPAVHATVPVTAAAVVALKPIAAVSASATSAAATPAATTTVTNPIVALVTAIQKALLAFRATYFNTPPKITVGASTKNADGTYTGQLVVSDVDGDPLAVYVTSPSTWGTTTVHAVDANTYTYTYTPSATAPITAGFTDDLTFSVQETNASSHYHGLGQFLAYLTEEVLRSTGPGAIIYPITAVEAGTTSTHLVITVDPETTTTT